MPPGGGRLRSPSGLPSPRPPPATANPEAGAAILVVATGQSGCRQPARFWDSHVGPGPRATPALSENRVYAFGATGILNGLHAGDGTVLWSRNAATDTGTHVPDWGFAGSPLAIGDLVVVAVSSTLAAYDRVTGEPRWFGPPGFGSYSSPHPLTIDGEAQILLMSSAGLTSVAPRDGRVLWEHVWPGGDRIVQPAAVREGGLLVSEGNGFSLRRIGVTLDAGKWSVAERWESTRLKPCFNDFVVHKRHSFGFDGSILACIDIEDGSRKWKCGRYGHGQLLLLADQDLLLVLSERGELVTVTATPNRFEEVARYPGDRGQDMEPPGTGRGHPPGSQQRGNGGVPARARGGMTGYSPGDLL